MIYGSVCSGIEAATVAWSPLGWSASWFSEIDSFANSVLSYHYSKVPNLGDLTTLHENKIFKERKIDILVGGTPCQSFSQAGLRLGLDDPRGNLALLFLRLAKIKQPRWVVWENVPGVLSSDSGRDFATILKTLENCGYGVCYRELDARNFGLPQNRKRIFVIGYLGDWRPAAAILFEQKTSNNNATRNYKTQGRIPVCTTRNAGNANARGVVVAEVIREKGVSDERRFECREGEDLQDKKGRGLRRLTPSEEERRMGFSGEYTNIVGATDALRYKAIGNSMAVPVMQWIGEGIQAVEKIIKGENMIKEDNVLDSNDVFESAEVKTRKPRRDKGQPRKIKPVIDVKLNQTLESLNSIDLEDLLELRISNFKKEVSKAEKALQALRD